MRCSALALIAVLAVLAVPPATSIAKVRRAQFRATIEGIQRIHWSVDTTDTDPPCGDTYRGSGREVIRFRSARPQRLTVRIADRACRASRSAVAGRSSTRAGA